MSKRTGYSKYSKLKVGKKNETFGEIQNRSASRVYIFGNDSTEDVSVDDDALELSEVRSRTKVGSSSGLTSHDLKKTHTIEKDVKPNDTLQRFALNFGCTMEEIKRANNLYSEQDFHALQKIKIPVQPHGILAQEEEEKQKKKPEPLIFDPSTSGMNGSLIHGDDGDDDDDDDGARVRTISIRSALDSPHSFLRSMDEDLRMICKGTPLRKANLDEVARTLTVTCIHPLKMQAQKRDLGNVYGIGWKGFLVVIVIVCIIIPGALAFMWLWPKIKS